MICSHQDENFFRQKFYLLANPKTLKHKSASVYYFIIIFSACKLDWRIYLFYLQNKIQIISSFLFMLKVIVNYCLGFVINQRNQENLTWIWNVFNRWHLQMHEGEKNTKVQLILIFIEPFIEKTQSKCLGLSVFIGLKVLSLLRL